MSTAPNSVSLRIPATSANLGPGFDTLGLALTSFLEIDAELSREFTIEASGRSPELCGSLTNNLVLMTYTETLGDLGLAVPPLRLRVRNSIPLGMGCGSSAAALVAGVLLARHFGGLNWSRQDVLVQAARREGHPDNVAACVLGGCTVAGVDGDEVWAVQVAPTVPAKLLLALPTAALSTSEARAVLPPSYSRADAVANIQASALLVAAIAAGQPTLLRHGMRDRMHEPYREALCPLYRDLKRLRAEETVYGLALSGAGPAVLLLGKPDLSAELVWETAGAELGELLEVKVASGIEVASSQLGNSQ